MFFDASSIKLSLSETDFASGYKDAAGATDFLSSSILGLPPKKKKTAALIMAARIRR